MKRKFSEFILPESDTLFQEGNSLGSKILTSNVKWLISGSLFLGFFLFVYGFYKNPLLLRGAWASAEDGKAVILFMLSSFSLSFLSFHFLNFKNNYTALIVLLIGPLFFITVACGVQAWIVPLLILFSSLCLGSLILRSFNCNLLAPVLSSDKSNSNSPIKLRYIHVVLTLLLGLGSFMLILGVMVHFPINYAFTYLMLLLLPIILTGKSAVKSLTSVFNSSNRTLDFSKFEIFLLSLLTSLIMLHTVQVCRPEMMMDALGIHLHVPAYVKSRGFWSFDVTQFVFAVMPMGADWLYSFAYVLADEYAIRVLNFIFMLLTGVILFLFFLDQGKRIASLLCIVLYLSTPLVFLETGSLFVENLWVLLLLGAFVSAYLFRLKIHYFYLVLVGFFSGAALSIKVTSLFLILLLALILLPILLSELIKNNSKKALINIILAIAMLLIFGAYPYLYAWYATGNPVFPFYNAIFKSPYFNSNESFQQQTYVLPFSLKALYQMTFKSSSFLEAVDGALGFQFLFFLPLSFVIALYSRCRFIIFALVVAWGYFLLVYPFQAYLRYLLPSFVIQSLIIGYSFWSLEKNNKIYLNILAPVVCVLVCFNVWFAPAGLRFYSDFPLKNTFLGKQEEELRTKVPERILIESINSVHQDKARVLFIDQNSSIYAGLLGEAFVNAWYNVRIYERMWSIKSPDDFKALVKEHDISHVLTAYRYGVQPPIKEFISSLGEEEFTVNNGSVYRLKKELF